jgi:hypothetical protein
MESHSQDASLGSGGGKWVRLHRDRLGQRWYEMSALQQVIQASGRIMRNEEDWGDFHIGRECSQVDTGGNARTGF